MRISDWSSDVCSSDLLRRVEGAGHLAGVGVEQRLDVAGVRCLRRRGSILRAVRLDEVLRRLVLQRPVPVGGPEDALDVCAGTLRHQAREQRHHNLEVLAVGLLVAQRSEEHTSELQSLMRNSYAVFCLQNKTS